MFFYPTERIALFIDGSNLYATAKALGFDIDYKRLLTLFRTNGISAQRHAICFDEPLTTPQFQATLRFSDDDVRVGQRQRQFHAFRENTK